MSSLYRIKLSNIIHMFWYRKILRLRARYGGLPVCSGLERKNLRAC